MASNFPIKFPLLVQEKIASYQEYYILYIDVYKSFGLYDKSNVNRMIDYIRQCIDESGTTMHKIEIHITDDNEEMSCYHLHNNLDGLEEHIKNAISIKISCFRDNNDFEDGFPTYQDPHYICIQKYIIRKVSVNSDPKYIF